MQHMRSPIDVVLSIRPTLTDLVILDIGCGSGGLVREMIAEGGKVYGIDPGTEAIRKATTAVPAGNFMEGAAEKLPFDDRSFDVVTMVNSLHHVPEQSMLTALLEAMRVLRSDGVLMIMEPLASGSFFAALRPIDDETDMRQAAQQAIGSAIEAHLMSRKATLTYSREDAFSGVDAFFDFISSVDPTRRKTVAANAPAITANVLACARRGEDGLLLFDQPIKVDILEHVGHS